MLPLEVDEYPHDHDGLEQANAYGTQAIEYGRFRIVSSREISMSNQMKSIGSTTSLGQKEEGAFD